MSKKLHSYRGRLTPAQIADGMNAALDNAHRLVVDAEILIKARAFASASSLAILAIEEAGKISVLRELSLACSDTDVIAAWKDYRSHTKKNVSWILPELIAKGARKLEDFRPIFDSTSDHPYVLDQLKQIGFYTDCLGNAHWSKPVEVIDEPLAHTLVETARAFANGPRHTAKEIQLWIEHLGPVWKKDMAWMKQALINWHKAMQMAGLAHGNQDGFENFVR